VDTFIEIGPGKTLSGFIKKISKEVRTLNVEDMDSLNKTLQELGK
jgi:[acyl-carrier-protein] S-malonyltransferase